ncbi:hypothetical protein DSCO28_71790 [Desulfosarcina ovata subsp. sediminis]|uniref:ABC transporter ATP-binding protein n=1 Tax=Desulfosarcina ovata subsp. sediminis TaxID=885957 RepID=A0A5K8A233_9BACT|nr:ABC transporter ATP-binding protein/permease [Desulfosarcina ovata]BBO86613.1 hypothetical protein DSCO28_71790 [Desulfosarcina ovata subsp. sediminis]
MPKDRPPIVKRSLYSFVFEGNIKLQILLLIIILIMVALRVLPLEMQKRIVNHAIKLKKVDMLVLYSLIYLGAIVVASGLKMAANALQTYIGQRALANIRQALYHHIITLPLHFFRKTQPGMVVSALVTEIAPAGDFVGVALAGPVTSVLTLLAFAAYLFWLNPLLAAISMVTYPIVLFLVPLIQKHANEANKRRVDATREMSSIIGETITGIHEVQSNGAFSIENQRFDRIVEQLFRIRMVWNLYRFGVKVTNNFFNNLSPFVVFLLGGYLAMHGRLELGAMVAFLSAQERVAEPWKELLDNYQTFQDASIRYRRTMQRFDIQPDHALLPAGREPIELPGDIDIRGLNFITENGIQLLRDISLTLDQGEHLAVVGFSGSGKSTLAQCIGQLYRYTGGTVSIGGQEVAALSKSDMALTIGYVSQAPFIFDGTIADNLFYACKALQGTATVVGRQLPTRDDAIAMLHQTGIFVDVLGFGMNTVIPEGSEEQLVADLLRIRAKLQQDYGQALADVVEFYDEQQYLYYADIATNIVFGTPIRTDLGPDRRLDSPFFREFLEEADLTPHLIHLGINLLHPLIDILGSLPPQPVFFKQSPVDPSEMPHFNELYHQIRNKTIDELTDKERQAVVQLALRFTPGVHKLISLPPRLKALILRGRSLFRSKIESQENGVVAFYRMADYIHTQTILNNVFFGQIKTGKSSAQERINQSIIQLLIEEDLLETIVEAGMQFMVGSKGENLSGGQRQKLAIARALLKKPPVLIMDEATSALDNKSQARIQNLLQKRWKGKSTLISVVHRLDTIVEFDKVAVMKAGKIVEIGTYAELMQKKGHLYELEHGNA